MYIYIYILLWECARFFFFFYFLAIVNRAIMNMDEDIYMDIYSFGNVPRSCTVGIGGIYFFLGF
jgi:hypothetical protein